MTVLVMQTALELLQDPHGLPRPNFVWVIAHDCNVPTGSVIGPDTGAPVSRGKNRPPGTRVYGSKGGVLIGFAPPRALVKCVGWRATNYNDLGLD
jgi:hypothetical protein